MLAVLIGLLVFAGRPRDLASGRAAAARAPAHAGARSSPRRRRMYVKRPGLFLGIGAAADPARPRDLGRAVGSFSAGFGLLGVDTTGESAGALVLLVVAIGTTLTLLGLMLVQAATACALVELDEGRPIGPLQAYRSRSGRLRPLSGALAVSVGVVSLRSPRPRSSIPSRSGSSSAGRCSRRPSSSRTVRRWRRFGAARSSFGIAGFASARSSVSARAGACGRPASRRASSSS